jgi:muramoyltetrapeptide carboxypeptidase
MRARPLSPDSLIDVIAPASSFDRSLFESGVAFLRERGFRVRYRPDLFEKERFLAGSDARRFAELDAALRAPDSDAIWCVRGGYGATRLLNDLSLRTIRQANKLLIGFSDVTALHARWFAAGVPSLHSTMVARLSKEPLGIVDRLFSALVPGAVTPPLAGQTLLAGDAEGVITGGNLALLAALCGTPFQPDLSGAIVALEDVGERGYRLDRFIVQCEQAGLFRGIAGLAFGEFFDCGDEGIPASGVLEEHARRIGVPTIVGLPFGHGVINNALPFGVRGRLSDGQLTYLEPLT